MGLKILLVDVNSVWLAEREDLRDLEQIIPPIGLMYVATYLRQRLNDRIEVKLINMVADFRQQNELYGILNAFDPDIVGLRGLNIYKKKFHHVAKIVKEFRSKIITVGAGPYVSMDVEVVAKDRNVDCFVIGEGEITFFEAIEKISLGQDFSDVKGMAYWKNNEFIINQPREFINDLDALPFPDYGLISIDKYSKFINYGYNRRRQAVLFSSRGCPNHCIYCHNIFGKEFRMRSAQNVFLELESLYKTHNIKDFYFVDDNFNLDYDRCMQLFDLIIASNMKINIYLANGIRGDTIDRPFIDKMIKSGVIWVTYSIETASKRLQKFIKKFVDLDKISENIRYTCEKGIMVNCCIMVGFPTETKEEAWQTVEYLKQFKKIVIPMFFAVKYYPNTEIYDLARKCGINESKMESAYAYPYHDIRHSGTPLISEAEFSNIYFGFLKGVFLSKERLRNAIEIQKKFLSTQELLDVYSIFFRKKINDLESEVLSYSN